MWPLSVSTIPVVGFDNSDDSKYLSPALTSISPGLPEVARLAVRVLKDRIDGLDPASHALEGLAEETDPATGKVFHKVPSSLVVRESTRPPIF